jgi:DNA ligase-1
MRRMLPLPVSCAVSLLCIGGLPAVANQSDSPAAPALLLANVYDASTTHVQEYWVSEKYDGIRAYWNGERLLTRGGNTIVAPAWFTADWPREALDGELWIGRGRFERLAATVRAFTPDDNAWRQVRYMVFDLPAHPGPFGERKRALDRLAVSLVSPWIVRTPHWRVPDHTTLMAQLDALTAAGGEGLMLHRDAAYYHALRSNDLLKLKRFLDAEAHVLGHIPGKGKYAGLLGALEVRSADGKVFRIGSGLTDRQRADPPPLGACITYRYRGLTRHGLPRFASFVRICDEPTPASTTLVP